MTWIEELQIERMESRDGEQGWMDSMDGGRAWMEGWMDREQGWMESMD